MTAPPPPLGPLRRGVREVGLGLITLGVAILLFVAYQLFGTDIAASASQASLERSFEHQVAAATEAPAHPAASAQPTTSAPDPATVGAASPDPSAPSGVAIDHLVIPSIGLDKYVVDGTDEADLSKGPGHYLGTPYPGQVGDAAIAGHRTTYGAPFFRIGELHVGDLIYLTDTEGRTFRYVVDQSDIVVPPSDVSVIGPTATATLTLTTCNPPLSATSRLVVKARLEGAPAPAPVVHPVATATPKAVATAVDHPNLTGGSPSAWPDVAGWGGAVVVLWTLTRLAINRTRRWARLGAYLVGIAVCCVPLWPCFESVARLLPQSI